MTNEVLDASVFLAALMPEIWSDHAQTLVQFPDSQGAIYHAPALLRYEVIAAARGAVDQKRLSTGDGLTLCEALLAFEITHHFDDALHRRAYELAEVLNQPSTYDAQYLAPAERLQCEIWTADERRFNSIRGQFDGIRWSGSLPA